MLLMLSRVVRTPPETPVCMREHRSHSQCVSRDAWCTHMTPYLTSQSHYQSESLKISSWHLEHHFPLLVTLDCDVQRPHRLRLVCFGADMEGSTCGRGACTALYCIYCSRKVKYYSCVIRCNLNESNRMSGG